MGGARCSQLVARREWRHSAGGRRWAAVPSIEHQVSSIGSADVEFELADVEFGRTGKPREGGTTCGEVARVEGRGRVRRKTA